jgi:p-aminobenzoyl-glutamate transporter AbgT
MCFSTVTVKKIRADKNCVFQSKRAAENVLSFLILNGVLCAQFVITTNNTNLGGTVPLAAVSVLEMAWVSIQTRGEVRKLGFFPPPPMKVYN